MKRFISAFCVFLVIFSFAACTAPADDYVSGVATPPPVKEYDGELARYENPLLGIIIEYPSEYRRIGNFDVDGHISFEGNGSEVFIYNPDKNKSNLSLTAKEYALEIIGLSESPEAEVVTYGKTTGYRTFAEIGGRTVAQFVVKGVDGFYRFDFAIPAARFSETDPVFTTVMSSIRIDDGIYNMLNKMLAEYRLLLEYATSMQYVTDANYANHCLNTFETSGDESYKNTAINTFLTMKNELLQISAHIPDEGESFPELWNKVLMYTQQTISECDAALVAIETGNIEEAQRLCRVAFTYDLSDTAEKFVLAISTEIGEY